MECDPMWREKLMDEAVLASLFRRIGEQLGGREARIDVSLAAVKKVIEAESATIDAAMTASVNGFGNEALVEHWHRALTELPLDSADGLARMYSLFETLCSAILHERRVPPLKDSSLRHVLEACRDELLRTEPELAREGARQILSAVQGVGTGIGTLRNRFSSAHGTLPGTVTLDPAYAMLAKNAVATAAIFLLSRHQASPAAAYIECATSVPSDPTSAPAS
jgi:hypothetical protein